MALTAPPRELQESPVIDAPSWKKRADIQGLRGLAVLLVVAYHADGVIPGGYIGVDVFFVLSGFVITGMVMSRLESPQGFSLSDFYLRRVVRLLPALALMLSIVAIATPFAISPLGPQAKTASTGRAASLFHANVELTEALGYFAVNAETNPLLHTWSLSVEEQFYLVFPALLLGVWALGRSVFPTRRWWPPVAMAAIAVPSFYLALRTTNGGFSGVLEAPESFAFYSSLARAWEFLAGAVLVFVLRGRLRSGPIFRLFGLGGLAVVLCGSLAMDVRTTFPGAAALVPVIGTCLLIAGGQIEGTATGRALSSRPLVWLGDRSYSWYLWHWPAIVFARSLWPTASNVAAVAAVVSLLPAAWAFSHFENRIRFADLWDEPRNVLVLAGICIFVPIGLFTLTEPALNAVKSADTDSLIASQAVHADVVRNCDSNESFADKNPNCLWTAPGGSGRSVALLGDSTAGQFVEGLAAASQASGYDFIAATKSGCPFVDLVLIRFEQAEHDCRGYVAGSIDDLLANPPDIVFISASAGYFDVPFVAFADPVTGAQARERKDKADFFSRQLRSTVTQLVGVGSRVHVIETIPNLPWQPLQCGAQVIRDPKGCDVTVARDIIRQEVALARTVVQDAVAGIDGASTIDFMDDICVGDVCSAFAHGRWMYRDGGHLSVEGSLFLTSRFEDVVRSSG